MAPFLVPFSYLFAPFAQPPMPRTTWQAGSTPPPRAKEPPLPSRCRLQPPPLRLLLLLPTSSCSVVSFSSSRNRQRFLRLMTRGGGGGRKRGLDGANRRIRRWATRCHWRLRSNLGNAPWRDDARTARRSATACAPPGAAAHAWPTAWARLGRRPPTAVPRRSVHRQPLGRA
ncbi:hypothetical protein GQ55_3G281200 [Panicum hallii var. hallii]|uniref:Uncharacterized protein n=1 Tax=Panicum hallii var. hallii TaxID=1504633 RepID=A0A2T7EE63_9POAL|nr:hypothetical protein GQ55_3G281200 [Panicum hallii var. hallii]